MNSKLNEGQDQVCELEKENNRLLSVIEEKELKIEDLLRYPDKKKLHKEMTDFINSETIEESVKRIMKDDSGVSTKFKGTNVSSILQQLSGKVSSLFNLNLEEQNQYIELYSSNKPKIEGLLLEQKDTFNELQGSIQNFQVIIAKKIFNLFNNARADGRIDDKEIQ